MKPQEPQIMLNEPSIFVFEHFKPLIKEIDKAFPSLKIMNGLQLKPITENFATEFQLEYEMIQKFGKVNMLNGAQKEDFMKTLLSKPYFRAYLQYVDHYIPAPLAEKIVAFTYRVGFDQAEFFIKHASGCGFSVMGLQNYMMNLGEKYVESVPMWEHAKSKEEFQHFIRFLYRRSFAIINKNPIELFKGSLVF